MWGAQAYLKPTRSSICCTLTWLAPTALIGIVSYLNVPPPVMDLSAGLLVVTPLATGHSLLPLAKYCWADGLLYLVTDSPMGKLIRVQPNP